MDFDKLLDDCVTLENTISALMRNNGAKHLELKELQNFMFEHMQVELDQLVDRDNELRDELQREKLKRDSLETDIRQYSVINEKLNELVAIAQKNNNEKKDNIDKNNEILSNITQALQESEEIKQQYTKAVQEIAMLNDEIVPDFEELKELTREGQNLVVSLHKNENIIRVLDQQNKFAEQQFDLILSEVPWEPLSRNSLKELLQSQDERVRDLAAVLELQTSELFDLNESLKLKKQKKIEILEQLANQLNDFVKRRSEAILMDLHQDKFMIN